MQIPTEPTNFYIHRDVIDNREEAIPPFFKKLQSKQKERLFDHAKSVFREWRPDTSATLAKCLENDVKYWKTANFCKNPDEAEAVKRVVTQHFV